MSQANFGWLTREVPPIERAGTASTPGTLMRLGALEADQKFVLSGGVFTTDVIETYIDYKRSHEINEIRMRPNPYEFVLYYDI